MSGSSLLLLLLPLLFVSCCAAAPEISVLPSHAAILARVQFNPDNIVANPIGPECPVENVKFTATEYDYTKTVQYRSLLRDQNVTEQCQADAARDLTVCYTDGTFHIKYGCCSKACRAAFQKSVDSGCAREYRLAACKDFRGAPLLLAGDVILKRCLDYTEMDCKDLIAAAAQGNLRAGLNQSSGSNRQSATGVSNEQGPKSQSSSSSGTDRGGARWRAAAAVLSAAALAALL